MDRQDEGGTAEETGQKGGKAGTSTTSTTRTGKGQIGGQGSGYGEQGEQREGAKGKGRSEKEVREGVRRNLKTYGKNRFKFLSK